MSKAFTLEQTDRALSASKRYTAEVASTAAEAIQGVDGAKLDKISAKSVVLATTGWQTDSSGEYPNYYDIADSTVTAADRADVTILAGDTITDKCQFDRRTQTGAGYIRIRAKTAPTEPVSAEYQVFGGK